MTATDWVQAIAMVVLVGVTIFYAWQARRTVNEMRLQRLTAKPVVIPDIDIYPHQKSYIENMKDIAQSTFPVALTNVGTAAAVELELSLNVPPESHPTRHDFISVKLPLLLPGANWRGRLTYVADFTEEGEPIFDMPPPEGSYKLKVPFRGITSHPGAEFSEVTLPFDLHYSGKSFYWNIKRDELRQKLLETKQQ